MGGVAGDPFYDGAVRTMGGSWRALLTGAVDPGGLVAIDKPPVGLWPQVAATRLLGFDGLALHLPAALAGCVAVLALADALRTLFGRAEALAGALALGALPIAVITARSDTMDALVGALAAVALALAARAARGDRPVLLVAAGAVLGLTFDVKPFEGLVAAPAILALGWVGLQGGARRRLLAAVGFGAATAGAGLAWLVADALLAGPHPWVYGTPDGSPWTAAFVYDGLGRLTGAGTAHLGGPPGGALRVPGAPGPLRLFSPRASLLGRFGVELAGALAAAVGGTRALRGGHDRVARAGWCALLLWLATGVALASAQGGLRPRYLEAVDPAVAGVLGAGAVLVARRWGRPLVLGALAAVLSVSLLVSVSAVARGVQDSGTPGALPVGRMIALAGWLRTATPQAAVLSVGRAGALVADDGQAVLPLTADGHVLVGPASLGHDIASGRVRAAVLGDGCPAGAADCRALVRWVRAHGIDASAAAGQPRGTVYALLRTAAADARSDVREAPGSGAIRAGRRSARTSRRRVAPLVSHRGRARSRPRR